jgi:hypothetical protein
MGRVAWTRAPTSRFPATYLGKHGKNMGKNMGKTWENKWTHIEKTFFASI